MNTLTVRDATAADQAAILDLERSATEDLRKVYRPTAVAPQHRAALDPQLRRLVAVIAGLVVGIVHYQIEDDRLSFLGLAVHPDFRRRGIATALIQELEVIGRDGACRAMTLWTVRETRNVEIFQRLGFAVETEEPSTLFESDKFPSLSEVFMRKDLFTA
jgi:ribosomal protein S18 acetylase RimI-like enzyme